MTVMVMAGAVPKGTEARAAPAETSVSTEKKTQPDERSDTIEDPYSDALAGLITDKMRVAKDREKADSDYNENLGNAEQSIKDMEKVRKHLDDQYTEYSDYDRLKDNRDSVDDNIDRAKSLLMETSGAVSTGEYKYGIEIAPDEYDQQKTDEKFTRIQDLSDSTKSEDLTVDKFRGFYDLSDTRKEIVKKALSEKGKISYLWGGKSLSMKTPKALDCSGFVRWVYHYVTGKNYNSMLSTSSVDSHYEQISHDDLQPGDIGMKNAEGTCYVAADGNKYSTEKAAMEENRSQNRVLKNKIRETKKDLKADIKEIKENEKSDISDIKAGKDPKPRELPEIAAQADADKDDTAGSKDKERNSRSAKTDTAGREKHLEARVLSEKKETDPDTDVVSKDTDKKKPDNEKLTEEEEQRSRIRQISETADKAELILKENARAEIKDLRSRCADENDISRQTGHIGIYAGKDKNGNDTWVHCTGGSKDTVVVTTEDEYDGFKYYYSPLDGEKNSKNQGIHTATDITEADYEVEVPDDLDYTGTKTYERYTAIRAKSSAQYRLEQIAWTDPSGFRTVQGRYLIAVGTGVTSDVGRYIDVVLENGTVIPCIVGDIKSDQHTDRKYRIMTRASRCVSEFIVDGSLIKDSIGSYGDVSYFTKSWDSPVKKFIVYKNMAM